MGNFSLRTSPLLLWLSIDSLFDGWRHLEVKRVYFASYFVALFVQPYGKVMFCKWACHSVHWDINPPQKHHPLFLAKPPFSGNPLLYTGSLWTSPENWIFQWSQKILKFFTLKALSVLKIFKFLSWFQVSEDFIPLILYLTLTIK